ncbi:hypothetical protein BT93_D1758 [Corymbia citriodora subsp. variegata]|nr:hypothetical protein BT93_D1758 [Corymbia citriodora subsp. variegata]
MKPSEILTRSFKLYPTTDQAAKYVCAAILKDSDFSEVDRAECLFSTTATVLDNGSQITPFQLPKTGMGGFFDSIKGIWSKLWAGVIDFITGQSCRRECSGFFDFRCHIQYVCMSWVLMFGLLLATIPTVLVLLWLLHQKGLFDPLYDWWEDHFQDDSQIIPGVQRHRIDAKHPYMHHRKHYNKESMHHKHNPYYKRSVNCHHEHRHPDRKPDYYYYLHHVQKDNFKHGHGKNSGFAHDIALDSFG